jgi:PKD repeat protein
MTLRTLLTTAALALAAVTPMSTWSAELAESGAQRLHPPKAAFPAVLPAQRHTQGAQAVQQLGQSLPEVAAWYGKSAEEFKALLVHDRTLRLDARSRLYVQDELVAPLLEAAQTPGEQTVLDGTLLPVDQTFLLHSRPGARRTIYLNFKGATLSGTAWNSSGIITALPFDLDGLPYSFTTAELQRIQAIWQRVAEDYAPFDVNVTTEAPGADALTRSSSTDQVFGTTVLITKSTGVYNCSCGGVAYIGVFDDVGDYYKPALVFYNQLGAGNEKYVAEAISHEVGHNMGLQHDGYSGGGYYPGHGSGATGWAPIMGVGYYQQLVQWSKGQYSTANNTQDDYAVMATNGLPLRTDDHGNTAATGTVMSAVAAGGISTYNATGVIESPTDVDFFSFTAAAGTVTVGLSPAARSANLDAQIDLRNAAGTVLATANPADALNASLSFTVASAGTYHVSVRGVGKGDPLAVGYTNYGSLGNYALQVTAPTSAGVAPVAALTATPTSGTVPLTVTLSGTGSRDSDGSIASYEWNFGDGSTGTGATTSHVYTTAGTYTAQLRVTDNSGLSSTKTVTITAKPAVVTPKVHVAGIAMSLVKVNATRYRGQAVVTVVDAAGKPVSGVVVNGTWSGLVTGTARGTTDSKGARTFQSAYSASPGTFTFTVTGLARSGYTYDAAANVETSDSITR